MRIKKLTLVFFVMALVFSTTFLISDNYNIHSEAAPTLSENKTTLKGLESDLKSIQGSLDSIKANIAKAKQGQQDQLYIKNQYDQEITLTETKIATLEKLISQYNEQITEKENEIFEKSGNIDNVLQAIAERLVIQQEMGNSNIISYILGSDDIADLLSRIEIANELIEYDRSLIEGLTNQRIELTLLKDELSATKEKCAESVVEMNGEIEALEGKIQKALDYLEEYKKDEKIYQAQYDKKANEMKEIEAEVKEILKQIELQERENYSNQEFIFPLPTTVYYRNTGGFGWRVWSNGRQTDFHKGVDFACARGTPIYASNSGTVIISKLSPSYGHYVVIDHGGGVTTLYAHCSKRLVNVGDIVVKGDKICEVGSTGDSTGNHLHFSVMENGVHVDPMKYISEP